MSSRRFFVALFAVQMLSAGLAQQAAATTWIVAEDRCPSDVDATLCFTNLQEAINTAVAGDTIELRPGAYTGNFSVNKGLTAILGLETARTFLTSGASGAALTLNNVTSSISIRNLTFINSPIGISAQTSPSAQIANNVFQVGSSNTAIQLVNSGQTTILNNTFFQNANGILSDNVTVNVKGNIFSDQALAMSPTIDLANIQNNLFFVCASVGPLIVFDAGDTVNYRGNLRDQDPLFVNAVAAVAGQRDFHLRAGSPCIDTGSTAGGSDSVDGTTADMGAYGGSNADTIPFQVQNVAISTPTSSTLVITWSPNNSYTVKFYSIYYGTSSGNYDGADAVEGASPITLSTSTTGTTATLSGLSSAGTPSDPRALATSPRDGALVLTWEPAAGATGYRIYHDTNPLTQSTLPANPATIGNTTTYTLRGLTNGVPYYTAVSAISQKSYYVAVTAVDANISGAGPGIAHESIHSVEQVSNAGEIREGNASFFAEDFPEPLVPYPNLPDRKNGCFIATAAYGNYSDPLVQGLRLFRDRYLMTNRGGRAFVGWYYDHSPALAAWLDAHPEVKPAARILLLPIAGLALFMTKAPAGLPIIAAFFFLAVFVFLLLRKRRLPKGGAI